MRFRFFRIPVNDSGEAEADLDRFLASHRVVEVERHLVDDGTRSMWALCVSYTQAQTSTARTIAAATATTRTGKSSVDYRQVLTEEEFAVFSRLRAMRKDTALKEGIPPYQVFNNEHLAAMVRGRMKTTAELAAISGVGQARLSKYAGPFVEALARAFGASGPAEQDEGAT
ncbi:MAG: HRDC domain-containing protein [Nannocystaceae bacterium]